MNQTEIGKFIAKCRKEKKLTQAQLAEKLNITDRAVSKWETGKSMPDSSIMLELCEILGITVNELLSGEEVDMENYREKADENLIALTKKDENNMAKNVIIAMIFSLTLLIGIMVCLICNLAISGDITWAWIPMSSIVLVWAIFFPSIILGRRGILASVISFSIFIVPYLLLLSNLLQSEEVFSIGAVIAIVVIAFLWIIVAVFRRVGRTRKFLALGIIFLFAILFVSIANIILSKIIAEPIFDVWDILSVFLLLILAFVSFVFDYAERKGLMKSRKH